METGDAPGARRVRLGNVPFLHSKPTYGDVVVVTFDANYNKFTWDSEGVPFERIGERIYEDGGRYAVIVDYELDPPTTDAQHAFSLLDIACANIDVSAEGCFGPSAERPGRVYLAVPYRIGAMDLIAQLDKLNLPLDLTLVHPV